MIINVGGRTDIVNYYGEWLRNRFEEGFAYTRNPLFPNRVIRYKLSPQSVDAVIFCSKNYAPFLEHLRFLTKNYRVYCEYTITAYEEDIEPFVPNIDTSIRTLFEVEKIVGAQRLAWRYDPILLTEKYSISRHLETFEKMANSLCGHIDRCVISFVEMHIKLQNYLPELIPLSEEDKGKLCIGLYQIAKKYNIELIGCGENCNFKAYGIAHPGCITLERLGKSNGCSFREIKHNGNRRGCLCIESRDLGWYDSCPSGCKYCFANKSLESVQKNVAAHDPKSPLLIGNLEKTDSLFIGLQKSYLKNDGKQISLFD